MAGDCPLLRTGAEYRADEYGHRGGGRCLLSGAPSDRQDRQRHGCRRGSRAEPALLRSLTMSSPPLITSVVGSGPVSEWLANVKTDFFQRKLSRGVLDEINLAAVKAAVKDQELAGLDVVTDGEMQRDN